MNMSRSRSITYDRGLFHLRTEHSSYMFRVTPQGQLEHLHYGARVFDTDAEALALKPVSYTHLTRPRAWEARQ